jgi:hypothetical protein
MSQSSLGRNVGVVALRLEQCECSATILPQYEAAVAPTPALTCATSAFSLDPSLATHVRHDHAKSVVTGESGA